MSRLVFLLEEYSMKVLLDGLLPRVFPDLSFLCVPHEGKQDLEKSVPRKLRAWGEPGVRFAIVRDNDGSDCVELKAQLVDLCRTGRREDSLVRIACQELEAWYFGEPEALAEAFADDRLRNVGRKAKYRDSDDIARPSDELVRLVPEFQKVAGARKMASVLTVERNQSPSFLATIAGIERILASLR